MFGGGTLGQQRRRVRPEAEDANQTFYRAGPPALGKPAELAWERLFWAAPLPNRRFRLLLPPSKTIFSRNKTTGQVRHFREKALTVNRPGQPVAPGPWVGAGGSACALLRGWEAGSLQIALKTTCS